MANQLSLLPPSKTFADIQSALQNLPAVAPEVDLTSRLDVCRREEWIFVGATGVGKTTLLRQLGIALNPALPPVSTTSRFYGVLDDSGQHDDATLIRTMVGMLRHQRTQRYHSPLYKPVILLRNATWHRIKNQFEWVPKERVGVIGFPQDAYADMLRAAGVEDWLIRGYLGPTWTSELCDAHGHFMPKLAWDATREIASGSALTTAKPRAIAKAAVPYWEQSPTLSPYTDPLVYVVPDHLRYRLQGKKLQIALRHISTRLLSYMQSHPLPMTRNDYVRAAEAEGIIKVRPQGLAVFAGPYAAALTTLKHVKLTR